MCDNDKCGACRAVFLSKFNLDGLWPKVKLLLKEEGIKAENTEHDHHFKNVFGLLCMEYCGKMNEEVIYEYVDSSDNDDDGEWFPDARIDLTISSDDESL